MAEAAERVLPATASDAAINEHVHHDAGEHDVGNHADDDSDIEHCADCCHAPCFWLGGSDFGMFLASDSPVIHGALVPDYSSERPPMLFRPPIA